MLGTGPRTVLLFVLLACQTGGPPRAEAPVAEPPVDAQALVTQMHTFAQGGGGERRLLALCPTRQPACPHSHWAGFFTSGPLAGSGVVERPGSGLLLVTNHPIHRESPNQEVVEEVVRWEAGERLVSTGVRYAKWGDAGMSSQAFREAVWPLLGGEVLRGGHGPG